MIPCILVISIAWHILFVDQQHFDPVCVVRALLVSIHMLIAGCLMFFSAFARQHIFNE